MTKTHENVLEFHNSFRAHVGNGDEPSINTGHENLRHKLIAEEILETLEGIMFLDDVEIADGLADIEYVIEGAAIVFGIELVDTYEFVDEYSIEQSIGSLVMATKFLKEDLEEGNVELVRASLSILLGLVRRMSVLLEVPLDDVLEIVHESNMSKLGENGLPILREDGKILKGPGYWEPKQKIAELLGVESDELQRA